MGIIYCCLPHGYARRESNEINREDIQQRKRDVLWRKRDIAQRKEELQRREIEERQRKLKHALERKQREQILLQEREEKKRKGAKARMKFEQLLPQSVDDILKQIPMSREDQDLFLRFQEDIGTTLFFRKDPQSLTDAQKSLDATEMFIQQNFPDIMGKWIDYKEKGKLTPELIDVIYAKERNPKLHEKKDHILGQMEQLNIIAKARSFNENGEKVENYYFAPCMLRQESPIDITSSDHDLCMVHTSVLCYVFKGLFLPPSIFDNLLTACVTRWPVAMGKETLGNLIFRRCAVFDLDLLHRLTLHYMDHAIFARIAKMGIDDDKSPNEKLCTRVRRFLNLNLTKSMSCLGHNLQYDVCVQIQETNYVPEDSLFHFSSPLQMWFADEGHDPDAPITPEHMNHARLCVALVTICGNAMREILVKHVPAPHKTIYQAIVFNKANLTKSRGRFQKPLLTKNQTQVVFPYPKGQFMAPVDLFDISLLYTLIRNVSTVHAPSVGWGNAPPDQPRECTLGASVERIRAYRNDIIGHSVDGKICQQEFWDYWKKIEDVVLDIEGATGSQLYSRELQLQKMQVISVYEAC